MGFGADRQALLAQIIAVTTRWLADERAVNPSRDGQREKR
jgi:hypothetical protein